MDPGRRTDDPVALHPPRSGHRASDQRCRHRAAHRDLPRLASETATALRSLGYDLRSAVDPRDNTAHRFYRGTSNVDLVASRPEEEPEEIVDVLVSDHHAPKATQQLAGRDMVRIEGGTQALRRTINAHLEIEPGIITTVSVPSPFGALILKAAAYKPS